MKSILKRMLAPVFGLTFVMAAPVLAAETTTFEACSAASHFHRDSSRQLGE